MEYRVLGWPADGPTLRLDYRQFSYAGKFVMSNTGKAVVRVDDETLAEEARGAADEDEFDRDVLAAVAFNEDRTDPGTLWIRYVTVREDRRGDGLGPGLVAFLAERVKERGFHRLRIAVNNPFAYEALYKAGFAYTGRQTGLAELVLARELGGESGGDADHGDRGRYQSGLDVYRERELGDDERTFLESRADADPPERIDAPGRADV
ncbi:GNAT family N-acetyltransferase [Haloprofundus salinisoli]|uniref:GNAT family N-acetyltransferase n=1 Tax=Haloprofundus salinisoli TaxID=2876193 RepID=UPI001CCBE93D|nr:GNAT family N-acetyltransferase [Haloprofundus salinisoli]